MKKLFLSLILITSFAHAQLSGKLTNRQTLGNGASEDVTIEFNNGTGHVLKSNASSGKIEVTHDGTNYKAVGSGSGGGGGGENFNNAFTSDQNADAETGTAGWTNTGGGTFSVVDNSNPNGPLGTKSFTFTPSAQNDRVCSPLLDFDQVIFWGKTCQSEIGYVGGDTNLDLLVVNGDDEILNTQYGSANTQGNNRTLPAHTIWAPESVSYHCPTEAEILADSDKGDLYLCVRNTGASAAPEIVFDAAYQGTYKGLSKATLPDELTAKISSTGVVSDENGDWIDGNCTNATNSVCTFVSGIFTVAPSCTLTNNGGNAATYCETASSSVSSHTIRCYDDTGTNQTQVTSKVIKCTKSGADANQVVQVYKSIPKAIEEINTFTAKAASSSTISLEKHNFIDGNCSAGACSFVSGVFDSIPNCHAESSTRSDIFCANTVLSTSAWTFVCYNSSGSVLTSGTDTQLTCERTTDRKDVVTKNISLAGIAVNSYAEQSQRQVRVESCRFNDSGTSETKCDSWIASFVNNGTGRNTITVTSGIFSGRPVCSCSTSQQTGGSLNGLGCEMGSGNNATTIEVGAFVTTTATNSNAFVDIICIGEK